MPQNLAALFKILQKKDTDLAKKGYLAKKGHLNFYIVGFIKSNNVIIIIISIIVLLLASLFECRKGIFRQYWY